MPTPSAPSALRALAAPASLALLLAVAAPALAGPPIVLDGRFDDWRDAPILLVDPADAPGAEVDLGLVSVAPDAQYLHLFIELGREVNPQRLDGRLSLVFDGDGNDRTGQTEHGVAGADLIIMFTPPAPEGRNQGMGVGVRAMADRTVGTPPPSPYDIGFAFAPTYASPRIELRIERGVALRGSPRLFDGRNFDGKLVFTNEAGEVVDETDMFTVPLPPSGSRGPGGADDDGASIDRADGATIRVMTWNVEFGNIAKEADRAARVIAALQPDVVLFQELTDETPKDVLEAIFERASSLRRDGGRGRAEPERWTAFVGRPGGDLRSGIATRLPMSTIAQAEPIKMLDNPDRVVRTAGVVVEANGKRLLVVSAHLKCCGKIGDRSDRTRTAEVSAMQAAIRRAVESGDIDGVVVGGDLNLVGGRKPLDMLATGTDVDGSALVVAEPYRLDGRSNATWADPRQPFCPGRLDYVLYSDASLSMNGGFVFDTESLPGNMRRRYRLEATDVATIADHFPLVIDLAWK